MLVDITPFLTAGAGLLAGLLVRRRRPATPKSPEPICPCGGSVSFHEGGTGRCHHQVKRAKKWDGFGSAIAYEWVPCACQHYAGPELVSSITMQPTAFRQVTDAAPDVPPVALAAEQPQEKPRAD